MSSIKDYQKAFRSNPDAFLQGAMSLCKKASSVPSAFRLHEEPKSLWDRLKPWLIALGTGIGGLYLGSKYGRHAAGNGNPHGPVVGTLQEALLRLANPGMRPVWRNSPSGKKLVEFRSGSQTKARDTAVDELRDRFLSKHPEYDPMAYDVAKTKAEAELLGLGEFEHDPELYRKNPFRTQVY